MSDEEIEIGLLSPKARELEDKLLDPNANPHDAKPKTKLEEITLDPDQATTPLDPQPPENEAQEDIGSIEDKAGMITQIMVPVCITMILVIAIVKTVNVQGDAVSQALVYAENPNDAGSTRFFGSLLNALIFVAMIIVVTVIFVVLYKYRCLKLIFGWLILSTGTMLGFFGGYLSYQILSALNIPMDWLTFSIVIWNFTVVGNISIFWHSNMKVNQAYLICISVILAVVFSRLPEWTTWTILAAIAIYDLFAVLCPKGPLRVLVETAQERDEPIPALIYNASIVMMMVNSDEEEPYEQQTTTATTTTTTNINTQKDDYESSSEEKPKGRGVKLGLGDFVFYSVLVGRAALFDMLTVFSSFIGIVTGLFCTILLLALWRKALPALPISIAFGILFYFLSKIFLYPFATKLIINGLVV